MDEYQREIQDLRAELERMVEEEADAKLIAEQELQVQVLEAIYEGAMQLLARGADDLALRNRLAVRGYGDWTQGNVYAFVYDVATELPQDGGQPFATEVRTADFAAELARGEVFD